ncbi:MAG: hypothetical protein J07HQW2_01358 [Haloquadratum walsbyi J07HQW2]|uniref:Uncharacterized protein n=1 Tax=Haloquadratum walsbyi J07HQW2 TaxID=1238425 RepID=U1PRG3_9EURY|nr:MAG: hypothetical protein J07HQW2_01358 [Haloquadratum walsbyi J07HQW2]
MDSLSYLFIWSESIVGKHEIQNIIDTVRNHAIPDRSVRDKTVSVVFK